MTDERAWVVIQHVSFEGPGLIATEAARRGIRIETCHPYRDDPLPTHEHLAGLVVMGGPMGVADVAEHPHLSSEMDLLADAVNRDVPVLGVCLGAQLLASALGATVYRGERLEFGVGRVSLTPAGLADPVLSAAVPAPPDAAARSSLDTTGDASTSERDPGELPVLHWHQDTFDLPSDAAWLARSELYPHQAFRAASRAYGLQFHVEVDRDLLDDWRPHMPDGIDLAERERVEVERAGRRVIGAFFDLAARST